MFFEEFYDAFDNVPKLNGTRTRSKGKVNGFFTGTREGVSGLFLGIYDGVSGLVREPIQGHKAEVSGHVVISC